MDKRDDVVRSDEAARLRRHWDAAVLGRSDAEGADEAAPDPTLVETIRRVHALDFTPGPSGAVSERIWEGVMGGTSAGPGAIGRVGAARGMADGGRLAVVSGGRRRVRGAGRGRSPLAEVATAALLLLTLGLGVVGPRLADRDGGNDGQGTVGVGIGEARGTPPTVGQPVRVDECRVEPRSVESLRRLEAAATGPEAPDPFDATPGSLPDGGPVDDATVARLNATLREQFACAEIGDELRAAALLTDAYLVRAFVTYGPPTTADLAGIATPPTGTTGSWLFGSRVDVAGARRLADGRIGAVVMPPTSTGRGQTPGYYLIFVERGDRFLIDEERSIAGLVAPPATPTGALDVPAAEECRVAPRSRESVLTLLDDTAGRTAESDGFDPIASAPAGAPADPETVAAVTATLRELSACENARDLLRAMALVSDDQLRLRSSAPGGIDAFAAALATPPAPRPFAERSAMATVRDVRVLDDGRVGAIVEGGTVARPNAGVPRWSAFVRVGGRLLLDESRDLAPAATPPATPETRDDVPAPEGCLVAPRTVEEIRRLAEQSMEPYARSFARNPVPMPTGPPADAETVAEVERTLREDAACVAAGDQLRSAALRTNGFLLRQLADAGPIPEAELAALGTPSPGEVGSAWELIPGEPVRLLPDGLVGAPVGMGETADGFEWSPEEGVGMFLVFAKVGDRYLFEDQVPTMQEDETGEPATPSASQDGGVEMAGADRAG